MKTSFLSLYKPLMFGLVTLLISVILAFFLKPDGVRINTEAWPPNAKSILLEKPREPITDDQWKRIRQALKSSENYSQGSHLFAAEIRAAWLIYLPLPLIALIGVLYSRPRHPVVAGILITMPSILLLILAFLHTHAYYS